MSLRVVKVVEKNILKWAGSQCIVFVGGIMIVASATSPVYLNDMILRIPHSSGMNVLWNAVDTCYIIACEYI